MREEVFKVYKMSKEEFIEKFLRDQSQQKHINSKKKLSQRKSCLPFKEGTSLDIINLFREMYGEEIEIIKDKDITLKYKGDTFNIKVISKRDRMKL